MNSRLQPGKRFLAGGFLLLAAGCASLPTSVPIQETEADQVRQEFKALLQEQRKCPAAVDADVSVTVDNVLWSGTLSGYLRAMTPAYLRMEGVNPLGLTEAILAVDGENFMYLSVRNQEAYLGSLNAEKIASFAPEGLVIAMNYYWLLGRIPPGDLGIAGIGLDANGQGHWLDVHYAATDERAMVLFDARKHLVKRHLMLNASEAIAADLSYEYSPATTVVDTCQLPSRIMITKKGSGLITLNFTKRYPTPALDAAPFRITPPAEYKRIVIQ